MEGLDSIVGVVGLGEEAKVTSDVVRNAASTAVNHIKRIKSKTPIIIKMDNLLNDRAAAEGSTLASYNFDHFKSSKNKSTAVNVIPMIDSKDWKTGIQSAAAQNLSRTLQETPANLLTPSLFVKRAKRELDGTENVKILIRDRNWVESHKMGAFLSVSNGSAEPLKFLELHYNGTHSTDPPLGLVGKGVTFDSGGISLKPSTGMAMMKGDMGGAAVALASFIAIAKLKIPINLVVGIPLTENLPSGTATKPGDLVYASNGLSIEVDNTDAEGRLILADALHYISTAYKPHSIIELSTLTGAMDVALGRAFAGVFSTDDELWQSLKEAGNRSGDRVWRMPFDEVYMEDIKSDVADLKNVGVINT
jgi:aminopeptidase